MENDHVLVHNSTKKSAVALVLKILPNYENSMRKSRG